VRSMLSDPTSQYVPIAALDDDEKRQKRMLGSIPVVGDRDAIQRFKDRADILLIAIPTATPDVIADVSSRANDAGLDVMILPSTTELFGMLPPTSKAPGCS